MELVTFMNCGFRGDGCSTLALRILWIAPLIIAGVIISTTYLSIITSVCFSVHYAEQICQHFR